MKVATALARVGLQASGAVEATLNEQLALEYDRRNLPMLRYLAPAVGVFDLIWYFFDRIAAPRQVEFFLSLRLFGFFATLVLALWTLWPVGHCLRVSSTTLLALWFCMLEGHLALMLPRAEGSFIVYCAGYSLTIGGLAFVPSWSFATGGLVVALTSLWLAAQWVFTPSSVPTSDAITGGFVVVTNTLTVLIAMWMREKAIFTEVAQRIKIEAQAKALHEFNDELQASMKAADRMFAALAVALDGQELRGSDDRRYLLGEQLGSGGFGVVFRATREDGEAVAIMVFRPNKKVASGAGLERFLREARLAALVRHENAVCVHDAGVTPEGVVFIIMELLQGLNLQAVLDREPVLDEQRAGAIALAVLEALCVAHEQGLVHRDIKPENVFICELPKPGVKVIDFGIAKIVDGTESRGGVTQTGALIGSPAYVSPERLMGGEYDGRSDVYAVGVILFLALSGRLPFPIGEDGWMQVSIAQMTREAPKLSMVAPHVPVALSDIAGRALAKDPALRPTARQLRDERGAYLRAG